MSTMSVAPARIAVMKADGRTVSCAAYKDELSAVLAMINNGSLAQNGVGGWGSFEHRSAVDAVASNIANMRVRFARDDAMEKAHRVPCTECGGPVAVGFEGEHQCGD